MTISNKDKFYGTIIIILIIFSIYSWYKEPPKVETPPTPQHGWLDPIFNIGPTSTVKCPDKGIVTIVTNTITNTVTVTPEWMKDRMKDEALIATGVVHPWKANTNVYTFMDLTSGTSRMYFDQQPVKPEPVKFFEWTNIKELGAFYGYGTKGRNIQFYGQWDIFRTGALNWKAKVEANVYDSKTDTLLLIGGAYQWK